MYLPSDSLGSEFGGFSSQNISTKKKANLRYTRKESVPITDYEIDKLVQDVKDRQKRNILSEKQTRLAKSHSDNLESTRGQRAIDKYKEMMETWKNDSERIAGKVDRDVRESVFMR